MDATGPADLPARWTSPEWREELEAWLLPALAEAGLAVTGGVEQAHVRFWSTVLHVETDAGRVWVKENCPSQGFEARLVDAVQRLAPGRMPPVVAVEPERGWLATRDLGAPLGSLPDVADEAWTALVTEWADLQRALEGHEDEVLATGLVAFPEEHATEWVAGVADRLHGLPADDARHLTAAERAHVEAGLPLVAAAAAELAASGLPPSLQHNDLHLANAFHGITGGMAFIDLADAVWAHPLTVLRIPMWLLGLRRDGPEGPAVRRLVDAALEQWTDRLPRAELRGLLPPADRLACLHRAVSWERTMADVPVDVVEPEYVRACPEWLLVTTDPDPYTAAVEDRHAR